MQNTKTCKNGKGMDKWLKTHFVPILFFSVNSKKRSSYHAIVPSTLVKLHLLSQKPRLVFIQQSLRKTPLWVGMPGPMFLLGGTIGGRYTRWVEVGMSKGWVYHRKWGGYVCPLTWHLGYPSPLSRSLATGHHNTYGWQAAASYWMLSSRSYDMTHKPLISDEKTVFKVVKACTFWILLFRPRF